MKLDGDKEDIPFKTGQKIWLQYRLLFAKWQVQRCHPKDDSAI